MFFRRGARQVTCPVPAEESISLRTGPSCTAHLLEEIRRVGGDQVETHSGNVLNMNPISVRYEDGRYVVVEHSKGGVRLDVARVNPDGTIDEAHTLHRKSHEPSPLPGCLDNLAKAGTPWESYGTLERYTACWAQNNEDLNRALQRCLPRLTEGSGNRIVP